MIDGHVDLPIAVREWYGNDINKINLNKQVRCILFLDDATACGGSGSCELMMKAGHFDIKRAREGRLGGMFWSM